MNAWTIALDSIWHHKLRSVLTALGIVIGVFAVVPLTSLGAGVQRYIAGQFDTFGADLITVLPAAPGTQQALDRSAKGTRAGFGPPGDGGPFGQTPSTLTMADVQAIAALRADHVAAVAPVVRAPAAVTRGTKAAALGSAVIGTTAPYFVIENLQFAAGGVSAPFSAGAVLGHGVAAALFGRQAPVGQTIQVGKQSYPVIGVLRASGSQLGGAPDQSVYIPVAHALALAGTSHLSQIVLAAAAPAQVSGASAAVRRLLGRRHTLQDFAVVTAGQILATINSTLTVITSVLGGIAAISLLVGGIGIMNIMLVTVTERIREIGTRKALGARDGDILVQFLVEALLLAVLGGAVGTGLSGLAGQVVGHAVHLAIPLTGSSVVVALAFSSAVGVAFGVLPALRAARLLPAEALRSE